MRLGEGGGGSRAVGGRSGAVGAWRMNRALISNEGMGQCEHLVPSSDPVHF